MMPFSPSPQVAPANMFAQIVEPDEARIASFVVDHARRGASRIMLAHRERDGAFSTVEEWTIAELADPSALGQLIFERAEREAQTLREAVTYTLFASDGRRAGAVGRVSFRIEAGDAWSPQKSAPESNALLQMALSHTDASARLALGHSRAIFEQFEKLLAQTNTQHQKSLETAQRRIDVLESREAEALEVRDSLLMAAHEREREAERAERKDKARAETLGKAFTALPLVLQAVSPGLASSIGAAVAEHPAFAANVAPTAPRTSAINESTRGEPKKTDGTTERTDPEPAWPSAADDRRAVDILEGLLGSIEEQRFNLLLTLLAPEQASALESLAIYLRARIAARQATPPRADDSSEPPATPAPAQGPTP